VIREEDVKGMKEESGGKKNGDEYDEQEWVFYKMWRTGKKNTLLSAYIVLHSCSLMYGVDYNNMNISEKKHPKITVLVQFVSSLQQF